MPPQAINPAHLTDPNYFPQTIAANSYRSHHCNALTAEAVGEHVTLAGWVHTIRDHGGVLFIMLRDYYGLTQLVCANQAPAEIFAKCQALRLETVIKITGTVTHRSKDTINTNLVTGKIEVPIETIDVLNTSAPPPFAINQNTPANADETIAYRYLYLRRPTPKEIVIKRSHLTTLIRTFLTKQGFIEIETPLLTKTTPEGARDFLVPSRSYPGEFYALPQSPQQYKQLLMVGGIDKYFQIARALRDEDSRADRQAEHTQLDLEFAFAKRDNIIALIEDLLITLHKNLFQNITLTTTHPFPRLTYRHCIETYGTDKPDLRFDLKIHNITSLFTETQFKIFREIVKAGGSIRALVLKDKATLSRKNLDDLITTALHSGLNGLIWAVPPPLTTTTTPTATKAQWRAASGKAISNQEFDRVKTLTQATHNDLILIAGAAVSAPLLESLSTLRTHLAHQYNLIPPNSVAFAFVTDFPLLAWNPAEKRLDPLHHMFVLPAKNALATLTELAKSHPNPTDQAHVLTEKLQHNPDALLSTQFDLIANGYELCSGSERIYTSTLQRQIMRLIGLADAEIDSKFAHLLKAFDFGAPPHGGAAPGIDRLLMAFMQISNIRDVIAFPKTQRGQDLMMNSPSPPSPAQLHDLALKIDYDNLKPERIEYLKQTKTFKEKLF
ncbi:aspartate--tRNA(Asp/Asn) ligase [Spirochaetota bacterium]|nr:aspartate--tRNA(Asp/Asn) ligase [Spirochaetota bacterium]